MSASKISLDAAKDDKLFYVAVNALVYRPTDGRCLILKRGEHEKVHPGKYATPGGKLEWDDIDLAHPTRRNGDVLDFENALWALLAREVREEAGIEIGKEMRYVNNNVFVRPDGIPVALVKFAVEYAGGDVVLEDTFTDFAWVDDEEVKKYDCIMGIAEEVKIARALFKK